MVSTEQKIGRNDPCACGSGKKYKHCCAAKAGRMGVVSWVAIVALAAAAALAVALFFDMTTGGPGSQTCPTGQVWSDAHGHCHAP